MKRGERAQVESDMVAFAELAPGLGRNAVVEMSEEVAEQLEESAGRKSKRKSPTSRTLDECRKRGWIAGVVERFVRFPPPGHHVDLFGVIDVVAIVPGDAEYTGGILGIQACAGSGHAARRAKILAEPRAIEWLNAGGRLELWSWSQRGSHFERKRWELRVEAFTLQSAWVTQPTSDPA